MSKKLMKYFSTLLIFSLMMVACGEENKIDIPQKIDDKKEEKKEVEEKPTKEEQKEKEKERIDISNEGWDDNGYTLKPFEGAISIDKDNSVLPAGVSVSEDNKTIMLPYGYEDFEVKIKSDDELEFVGNDNNVVSLAIKADAGTEMNTFVVKRAYLAPSEEEKTEVLRFRRKGLNEVYSEDNIKVVIATNPNTVSGMIAFNNVKKTHNFNDYVENEIGVFELAEDKKIDVRFDTDEDRWVKIQTLADNNRRHKVIAGWRANDPKADGREQKAYIIISNNDGSQKEEYTVVRRNYGLPVVKVGKTWWCKYNLRGNVKKFSDQILTPNDPARGQELSAHLTSCSEEELLKIMGDQYQVPHHEGMKLMYDSRNKYYHTNFKDNTGDFGNTTPTDMAPTGYRIPTSDAFKYLMSGNNMQLTTLSGEYSNGQVGQNSANIVYDIHKRNVSFFGGTYGDIRFYEFKVKGEEKSVILFGLGHQWVAAHGNVDPRSILFASHGQTRKAWQFDSNTREGETNRIHYANNNPGKTRTIRCVKSHVEYEY